MKRTLSKRTVDALKEEAKTKGRTLYCYDENLTGFGIYATKAGKASYFVQYRTGGRETPSKRITIGKHGVFTAEQARAFAKEELGKAARGVDLVEAKKSGRRKLAAGTFKDVMERYLSTAGQGNKSWPETRRLLEHDAIPVLGNRPITSIARGDVAALVDKTAARSPAVARALFAQLRPLFKWAQDRGAIEINPIAGFKGPAPVAKRKRTLDHDELKAFWIATGYLDWPFAPVYRLLLLSGQRREEVGGVRWEEIDLNRQIWRLPPKEEYQPQRTKNGEEHIVDLSPQALAILEALPGERKGLVFTTTGKTSVSGFSKAKARLDNHMTTILSQRFDRPLLAWRVHDLRRTASTLMGEDLGIDTGVIDRIQNHITGVSDGLKGVYQQQKYRQARRAALIAWGAHVESLVSSVPEPTKIKAPDGVLETALEF